MYPNLYFIFKDLFGIEISGLKLVNSFGFFVALAFIFGAWILTIELRRKSKIGLLTYKEEKVTVGKPASKLINDQVLLEAKRYLLATPNQVKDIADHLGYEDISYFIRFFKKHTGFSPEAFRKNFQ